MVGNVDVIYAPTDNMIAAGMATVSMIANDNGLPTVVGESGMVEAGGLVTYGIDYYQLGYQTGEMAVQILKDGKSPEEIAVATSAEPALYLNLGAAQRMGVEIPVNIVEEADPANITE